MFWFVCKRSGHKWKTHRRGFEMAFWECKRLGCHAKQKAPWYRAYQEFCGYKQPLHPID